MYVGKIACRHFLICCAIFSLVSPQSGVPYEKRQPSHELRSFLDPLKPGAYFDCGRARLYGIDEVLEQEAERRGRPVGADHFQLVATDGGLIFCRASITFAIAARWKDVTISRPVDRSEDERVDLAVIWPNHGELTFTVSRRLASNVFRQWLQYQARNTRRHQVEQAARYEQSQRTAGEDESRRGTPDRNPRPSSQPAPETVQLDEAQRDVLRRAVRSGDLDTPSPMDDRPGMDRPRSEVDVARVVPAGDMAATTHFDDRAAQPSPSPGHNTSSAGQAEPTDPRHHHDSAVVAGSSGDDWRNGWTYSDDHETGNRSDHQVDPQDTVPDQTSGHGGDVDPGREDWDRRSTTGSPRRAVDWPSTIVAEPAVPRSSATAGGPQQSVEDDDRMRRAAADTQIFPDTARPDSRSDVASTGTRRRGGVPLHNGSRAAAHSSDVVRLGDLDNAYHAGSEVERRPAADHNGVHRSRGGYLDGLPAAAGDAASASSEMPDGRTRPDSSLDPSTGSVSDAGRVDGGGRVPVPQISGARLQASESAHRRRHPDGLDIRSAVLSDSERSVWSDMWHRHRISIMATVSLVALLVIAVSSLLSREGEEAASQTSIDADIAIPTRQDPAGPDPVTGTRGEANSDSTPLAGSDPSGTEAEPNTPMVVDDGGGGVGAIGGDTDTGGQAGSNGTDQATATTTVRICHSNYGGCVPVAPDVDCEGDGDGPAFLSEPVAIFGEDVYELDTDGDREACEPDQPSADQDDT